MTVNIPIHTLPSTVDTILDLKIYRFKNNLGVHKESPVLLPITPLPTDTPHRHSYYEILFIEEGQGIHEIDFHSFPISGPGLHFLTPGQVHLIHSSKPCQGYILAFSAEFYSFHCPNLALKKLPFFQPLQKQPIIAIDETERSYIHNLMENMVTEYLAPKPDQSIIGKYLGIILHKSSILSQNKMTAGINTNGKQSELIGRFQEMVEKNFLKIHEVQTYAKELDVSPDYLSKTIKRHLLISAQDYILEKLLLEAKRLLVFTQLTSKEIAYHINIEDPSYFSRIFKKKTGHTPNDYREQVRKSTIF